MNPTEAWQSVLGLLQREMPRAPFETWVQDTEAIALETDVLIVAAHNAEACDWLESRLTSTAQRLLIGILHQSVSVRFVPGDLQSEAEEEDQQDVALEPVQWLDYEKIVQPQKLVVVKGYLRRLGMEIGPKAVWLYIGFHQAAWQVHAIGKGTGLALYSRQIMRFSGMSNGAFWRLLRQTEIQSHLDGLVQRMDPEQERKYHRGRDGRPHRIPIRYQVSMTPRLTRADAAAVYSRLKNLLDNGRSMLHALQELLAVEDVMDLLHPGGAAHPDIRFNTVMDMARLEQGETADPKVAHLAQELQRRIINSMGDIHITHYFILETIRRFNLTPAQAWLVTVARDMAYLNSRTGERREVVTFRNGYQEMAALIGSKRCKTVQAWLSPHWSTQQRGGNLNRFLGEVECPENHTYSDLRTETMPRRYRVLLDEPLDADGSHMADADGGNSQAQMGAMVDANGGNMADANGGNMADANGSVLNSLKHLTHIDRKNSSTSRQAGQKPEAVPAFWELKPLLEQNNVHPKVQQELLKTQASVQALVSWVLYVASPQSGKLSDPLGYAISRLREHALREAHGVFRTLASLPPAELLKLIDRPASRICEGAPQIDHPLTAAWRKAMGPNNHLLPLVRVILFGEKENE